MRRQENKRIPGKIGELETIAVQVRIEGRKRIQPSKDKNAGVEKSVVQGRTAEADKGDSSDDAL